MSRKKNLVHKGLIRFNTAVRALTSGGKRRKTFVQVGEVSGLLGAAGGGHSAKPRGGGVSGQQNKQLTAVVAREFFLAKNTHRISIVNEKHKTVMGN